MSSLDLHIEAARAGRLDCACTLPGGAAPGLRSDAWRLAFGFGFAVLAQALTLTALPLAGATLAPGSWRASLPYALTLLGAAMASLPASLLLDRVGRRAAFALGAAFGIAGGALAGWAITSRRFPELCVGALWLGVAQGFALFYRHAAAAGGQGGARAALTVLCGGCLASLAAPSLVLFSQGLGPYGDRALMLAAGIASFAALPILLTLPHRISDRPGVERTEARTAGLWPIIALGAGAWFGMAHVMASAPSALIGCGIGQAALGGLISWHLVAMYGPMALATQLRGIMESALTVPIGALCLFLAMGVPYLADAAPIELLLIAAGAGWSLVQIGLSPRLYASGRRSRTALAVHDTALLAAAVLGALTAGA
ncbi:MAG: MFS transporter [Hyphomicrobiales bacterium]